MVCWWVVQVARCFARCAVSVVEIFVFIFLFFYGTSAAGLRDQGGAQNNFFFHLYVAITHSLVPILNVAAAGHELRSPLSGSSEIVNCLQDLLSSRDSEVLMPRAHTPCSGV
jgi:hypothetical protein